MSELKSFIVLYDGKFIRAYEEKEADKVIARNKYKRCLAMVQVLEHVCPMTNRKAKWRDKWHKRWLKIGQQFKEAK